MKRLFTTLLLTLAFAFALSTALATGYISIDDSGVDYENTSLSKVWIGLDYVDGIFVLRIDDDHFEGALASRIDFDVPDLATQTDIFGNDFNADLGDVSDVSWVGVNDDMVAAKFLVGLDATHLDTNISAAVAAYDALFRSLGFTSTVTDTASPSVKVVTFSNGTATMTAHLHAKRGDVSVKLRSL